ncbi:sensor histidine kinase [Nocardioides pacificus]
MSGTTKQVAPGTGARWDGAWWEATLRRWAPDVGLALLVLVVGILTATGNQQHDLVLVALGMALAVLLSRHQSGWALVVVWFTCGAQIYLGIDISLVQLAVVIVAYGCARYGTTGVLWVSGASIPAGGAIAMWYVLARMPARTEPLLEILVDTEAVRVRPSLALALGGLVPLMMPWLIGLVLRARDRAKDSQAATESAEAERRAAEIGRAEAQEVARLREEQTRLARDVHDVVGHSLAVILAQAESAQFLPDDDPDRLKETLANVATSARASLGDVRRVLTSTSDPAAASALPAGGLDSLVEGVRASGRAVESTVVGTPRPLPPELDVVAFRVLQEMLTNALKHGRRGEPVLVERHWQGDLRIEVRNVASASDGVDGHVMEGRGLDGMRRRLESVGGRLDVRRRDDAGGGSTFTATAWVPLRAQEAR